MKNKHENDDELKKSDIGIAFIKHVKKNDLKNITYLLNFSCSQGHTDIVKSLINNKYNQLNDYYKEEQLNHAFILSCSNGHVQLVEYFLTSSDLKTNVKIDYEYNQGFRLACENGQLEVVEYLLTNTNLKEHANIHAVNDYGLLHAMHNGRIDVVKFLIFDMDIKLTEIIKDFECRNKEYLFRLFEIRELNKKLGTDLSKDISNLDKEKSMGKINDTSKVKI